MITEDYISLETAKLLKEKGFDEEVLTYYIYDSETKSYEFRFDDRWDNPNSFPADCISAPTLQMTMKWLREVHNIFIRIIQSHIDYCTYEVYYDRVRHYESKESYNTYEEACEEAIKYCLENLI